MLKKAETSETDEATELIRGIYLGSALAWAGKYAQAVEVLEGVPLHLVPAEWGREAQWTLYEVQRVTGRRTAADSLLQILSHKPGEIGDRARERLR
jgi:hypothetical protein